MTCVFMTFGGPTEGYHRRVHTLCQQARQFPMFTHIHGFTETDLQADEVFWKQHGAFIEANPRGYGYWLWKSYLILRTLSQLQENDVLLYVDAGCTLNVEGLPQMEEYMNLVRQNFFGMVAFQLDSNCSIGKYTKRAVLDWFHEKNAALGTESGTELGTELGTGSGTGRTNSLERSGREWFNDAIEQSGQYIGGVVLLKKTSFTMQFMEKWYHMSHASNYTWLNDTKIGEENPMFIDHRHDQSIYTLLIKTFEANHELPPIVTLPDETFFYPDWTHGRPYPIWATRIRG